jgi:hypothetical protein
LVRKPNGKRPARRPSCRWEDITIDFREIVWEDVDWIHLNQDGDQWQALVNMVMNLQVPQKAENFLNNCVTVSFSRGTLLHGVGWLRNNRPTNQECRYTSL